jgi:acetoacetate decarboxylase
MTVEWLQSSETDVAYPAAPWPLAGSMWLTLFHLRRAADETRPAGLYGAAFVSYDDPSPLTYSELLVARVATVPGTRRRRASVTDIWVDSPASMAGGRELWAIPKGLADFELDAVRRGPLSTTEWTARDGRVPIATASFSDVSRAVPRTPFAGGTWQPGLPDTGGEPREAPIRGSARSFAARARWDVNPDGPLGWMTGARQLGSVRLAGFRMRFG